MPLLDDTYEDLERMYALLSQIPDKLEPLKKKMPRKVSQLVGEGTRSADGLDPKAHIDALSEVHRKILEAVIHCFECNAIVVASSDSACREFVNRNAATGASTTKSSELLTKYADMLSRKNNKVTGEENLEDALTRIVSRFRLLICLTCSR